MEFTMKKLSIVTGIAAAFALSACSANVEEEGELPEMDVDVSGDAGALPEIDVDTADIDVGTEKKVVEVPDVDVTMPGDADAE